MSEAPVPYMLKPKATKLAEGPDPSLEPTFPPVDPAVRSVPPTFWPRFDTSKGGTGPPDPPLAPPGVDSTRRTTPTFAWPRPNVTPNRPLVQVADPNTLDPDIALWPVVPVQIWPFTGAPTTGRWPRGWVGIDNTNTMYVCTAYPDTWAILAQVGGGGSGWPTVNGSGSGNLDAVTLHTDTVGLTMIDAGSGGLNLGTRGTGALFLTDAGSGGITILEKGTGAIIIQDDTGDGVTGITIESNATNFPDGVNAIELLATGESGNILIQAEGTDGIVQLGANLSPGSGASIILADSGSAVTIGGSEFLVNNASGTLGFFNATPVVKQSSSGVTTVTQVLAILRAYGLCT